VAHIKLESSGNYFIALFVIYILCRIGDQLAFCLKSFVELMDHGIEKWEIVEAKFIKTVISWLWNITAQFTNSSFNFSIDQQFFDEFFTVSNVKFK